LYREGANREVNFKLIDERSELIDGSSSVRTASTSPSYNINLFVNIPSINDMGSRC